MKGGLQLRDRDEPTDSVGTTHYNAVADVLRADILNGRYAPASRLKAIDLTRRYGVSAAPIREALQQLQAEGLVTLMPNRGARVRAVDERSLRNIYGVRSALEGYLARLFVENASDADIDRLADIQARYDAEARDGYTPVLLTINREFHALIATVADNEEASGVLARYHNLTWALRVRYGMSTARARSVQADHAMMVRMARRRDADGIAAIAAGHVRDAMDELLQRLADQDRQPDGEEG